MEGSAHEKLQGFLFYLIFYNILEINLLPKEIEQIFCINSNIPARLMSSKILYQKSSKVKNLALKNNGLRQRKMTQLFLPPLINDQYIMLMEAPQVLLWQHILMDFSTKPK
jgi:hypothetical protein